MIHTDRAGADELMAEALRGDVHLHVVIGGSDRESALSAFARSLVFPDYFGHNLDALLDCLRDLADLHEGDWTLLWRPLATVAGLGAEGPDDGVLGVLADLEQETAALTVVVSDL